MKTLFLMKITQSAVHVCMTMLTAHLLVVILTLSSASSLNILIKSLLDDELTDQSDISEDTAAVNSSKLPHCSSFPLFEESNSENDDESIDSFS